MKTFNENVAITYDKIEMNLDGFKLMRSLFGSGIPPAMEVVVQFGIWKMLDLMVQAGCEISYQLARSTYGREQYLNVFEQFIVTDQGQRSFRIYLEFANDPHHRIDALKKHDILMLEDETHKDRGLKILRMFEDESVWRNFILTADQFLDGLSFVEGEEQTLGLWFKHEHGMALIGIEADFHGSLK
jgi:hypothetical protein